MRITLSEDAKSYIARESYDPHYGARPVKRYLQKYVETAVAEMLIRGDCKDGDDILVGTDENGLTFETVEKRVRVKRSIKNARGGESQRRFAAPRVCFLPFCGRLSCTYLLKDRRKKEASAAGKVKIFRESRAGITSLKYGFGDIDILITAVVDIRCVAGKTAAAECHRHVGGYVLQQYGRFVVEKLVSP